MQQAIIQPATGTNFQTQATPLPPDHSAGGNITASNDETFRQQESALKMTLSVLANVVGGAVLLAVMFNLPIILAVIWGL